MQIIAIKKIALLMLPALILATATGCLNTSAATASTTVKYTRLVQADSLSIWQLAKRVGLKVQDCSQTCATLRDDENTVVIFSGANGRAFVNDTPTAVSHDITAVGDTLFVPSSMEQEIRALLPVRRPAEPIKSAKLWPQRRPRKNPPPTMAPVTVVIDPGHGGKDPGAIAPTNGLQERQVNLSGSLILAEMLDDVGLDVRLTRKGNMFIPLDDRAAFANDSRAKLFVSIHADSAKSRLAKGPTLYIARGASKASIRAANAINRRLASVVVKTRGVKRRNFRVLVNTKMPAVLVELGFLTNRAEAAMLADPNHRRRLARAIADGIVDYLQANR